jgi:hypothetical protein
MQSAILQSNNAEIGIKVNIRTFTLPGWVTEESPVLNELRNFIKTGKKSILNKLRKQGIILDYKAKHNIIVTAGRNVLARRLAGNTTYTGAINYGVLGTQAGPTPTNASTQLGNEVFRKLAASQSYDTNIAFVDFVYTAADTNGTYTEFGNVIDGTGAANSGQLFSYIATGGWVKTAFQSLFVSCQYTIN